MGRRFKKNKNKKTVHHLYLPDDMLGFVFPVCDENSIISQQTKWVEFFLRFSDWHAPCIGELVNGCDGSLSARVYIVNILV